MAHAGPRKMGGTERVPPCGHPLALLFEQPIQMYHLLQQGKAAQCLDLGR